MGFLVGSVKMDVICCRFGNRGFHTGWLVSLLVSFDRTGGWGGNGTAHGWVVEIFLNKMKNLSFSL